MRCWRGGGGGGFVRSSKSSENGDGSNSDGDDGDGDGGDCVYDGVQAARPASGSSHPSRLLRRLDLPAHTNPTSSDYQQWHHPTNHIEASGSHYGNSVQWYWDLVWNFPDSEQRGIFAILECAEFKVMVQNEYQVEVSFSRTWNPSLHNRARLNIDISFSSPNLFVHDSEHPPKTPRLGNEWRKSSLKYPGQPQEFPLYSNSTFTVPVNYSHQNFEFNTYSPSQSSTSKKVPCSSSFCDPRISCTRANSSCPYIVEYLSENTSSSGILVEDVLYFTQEDARSQIVEAPVVFGCEQFQTGAFLDGAALNGLFGLGMNKISVPSILSSKGLTSNSFSMCFGSDGVGRINFGDEGSAGQDETPFNMDNS